MDAISYSYADEAHSRLDQVDIDLPLKEDKSNKGAVDGYAGLDSTGKVPLDQLPNLTGQNYTESLTAPTTPNKGDEWLNLNNGIVYKFLGDGADSYWVDVTSIAGQSTLKSTKYIVNEFIAGTGNDGQTFNIEYVVGAISVSINGIEMSVTDYTATDGTSVVLNVAADTGDIIIIKTFDTFFVADTYTRSETNALLVSKSDINHNHDGIYEPADATILKDADIGVSVQSYDANTVIDASYVHTDNNYTTTEKSKLASYPATYTTITEW